MKNIKLKPYQKLLVLFEQKAKLRKAPPFSNVEVTVEEIEASLANEIHMYRLSTYIWHIKTMVGGVVSSIRGDTPETKRKVVAYRIHNWDGNNGVREALIRQGVMVRGTSNSTYKLVRTRNLKKHLTHANIRPPPPPGPRDASLPGQKEPAGGAVSQSVSDSESMQAAVARGRHRQM